MWEAKELPGQNYRVLYAGLTQANKCTRKVVEKWLLKIQKAKDDGLEYNSEDESELLKDDDEEAKDAGIEIPDDDEEAKDDAGIEISDDDEELDQSRVEEDVVIAHANVEFHKVPVPSAQILSAIGIPLPTSTPNLTVNFDRNIMNGVFVTFQEDKGKFTDNQLAISL
jgi:hypothetical protein